MFKHCATTLLMVILAITVSASAADEQVTNSTSTSKKLFTYAGPLLPNDWSLVSILNDRAVIGFANGSARSALMEEFEPKEKLFLQRLQNGTIYSTPLSSAREKLSQWSSSVSSTVSKLSKSVKDQFDSLVNNNKNGTPMTNITLPLVN